MKIAITGSEGLLGKLSIDALKEEHKLVLLDKKNGDSNKIIDLLREIPVRYFKGVETVVHFAANASPLIGSEEAKQNTDITFNVLEGCRINNVKRIIYASSINVYDLNNLYGKERITSETPVCPNSRVEWGKYKGGIHYPISKIVCEAMVKAYSQGFGMSSLILRFGSVPADNHPNNNVPEDCAIWLSHEDFKEIIKRAVGFEGVGSLACVSNNSEGFVDLKPLERVLGYVPRDNSEKYKC